MLQRLPGRRCWANPPPLAPCSSARAGLTPRPWARAGRIGASAACLIALALATTLRAGSAPARDWSRYVDPFIGTGGHGHTYPGATLPFGMVQLSPDTRLTGWDGCSGYHDSDRVVYGFSHTHLSGTGVSDYGDILFMPLTGTPKLQSGYGGEPGSGYGSRFDKDSEHAEPGWYAVHLSDYGVDVELTATERTGLHRYEFPAGRDAHVLVDLQHRDEVLDAGMSIVSPSGIEGWRRSTGWARDQIVYFAARFSRPFSATSLALDDKAVAAPNEVVGRNVKGLFSFGTAGGELLIKVGISAVDLDGARRNLEGEQPGWGFEELRYAARLAWNEALGRIEVTGGTEDERIIFYTALYHSLVAPNLFSDVDGRYRGMDGRIHVATGRRHYTVFSLWDTFRATHPLYTLLWPERAGEFIATFLAQHAQGGRLPVWELAGNETDCMIGYHSVSVIADAWMKGIRGFDAQAALDAMIHSATLPHFGLEALVRQGFIGGDDEPESVSKTLEYAYDDWCIARMAAELDRDDVAQDFQARSQAWRHLLDPETGFMRPRLNQRWLDRFDPRRVDLNYTEANAWQYTFFVPHDVPGLIAALGGDSAFVARLDSLFESDSQTTGREQADITGRIGQYAHGNEPSHHVAWLYHYAGRPDKSAERVRSILNTLYATGPEGLCGNEDCGQMSSWYVLSALGLYPVCPGANEYVLVPPLFEQALLRPERGKPFRIRTKGGPQALPYVEFVHLNGRASRRSFVRHDEIARGRELVFALAAQPGPRWGRDVEDRPGRARARKTAATVLPAPFVRAAADVFRDSLVVALDCAEPDASLSFALLPVDSGATTQAAELIPYDAPFVLRESTKLRFVAAADERSSPVVEATFHRLPHDWNVHVTSAPNAQYTAGGPQALVDGLRGKPNWRLGGWQGYQDTDFECVVDLGQVQPLTRVGAGFLQDVGSWIWMPKEVLFSVSSDGKSFRQVAALRHEVSDREYGTIRRDLGTDLRKTRGRYLKVTARNYGQIPAWHPGQGGAAFIFVDEILVE